MKTKWNILFICMAQKSAFRYMTVNYQSNYFIIIVQHILYTNFIYFGTDCVLVEVNFDQISTSVPMANYLNKKQNNLIYAINIKELNKRKSIYTYLYFWRLRYKKDP